MYGHPGLHVVDGSALSANLGVNPALTITAQAERAIALWPNKDDSDPRPLLGAAYKRVVPVAPRNPIVPASAPTALKLPIVEIRQTCGSKKQIDPRERQPQPCGRWHASSGVAQGGVWR
jgi:hypothetical protein